MADEPIKPTEQKAEPKKDTVRITLPPKISTATGASQPTVRLPAPPATPAAKAAETTPAGKKEADTKTIPGARKRETQSVKTDTSKVKTSPAPGVAAARAAAAAPAAVAPLRPTTVRLPSPAEVQQAAARQPIAPPAPLAPTAPATPAWVTALSAVVAVATLVTAVMLFLQYQSLGS